MRRHDLAPAVLQLNALLLNALLLNALLLAPRLDAADRPLAASDDPIARASATEPSLPVLTLADALRAAAEAHPSVAVRLSEQSASEFSLDGARWRRWPELSMSSSRGQLGRNLTELQIEQPLWAGGRIDASIHAAEARVDAARSSVAEARQLVLERTATVFAEAMRLQARLAAADAAIADYTRLSDMIERRVAAGISPRSDGVTVRARLQQAQGEQLQMALQRKSAGTQLEVLVGRRVGELATPRAARLTLASVDEALEQALAHAPQLQRLGAEERVADQAIAASKGSLSPTLALRYQRTFGGGNLYPTDQLFFGVSFQPGSGLSAMASIHEAQQRRSGAIHTREATRRELVDQVRSLWNVAESAQAEQILLAELVSSTRQVYESCLRQFPAGRRTWLEVLLARRDLTQAQYALADAQWTRFSAVLRLEIASGRLSAHGFQPGYELAE